MYICEITTPLPHYATLGVDSSYGECVRYRGNCVPAPRSASGVYAGARAPQSDLPLPAGPPLPVAPALLTTPQRLGTLALAHAQACRLPWPCRLRGARARLAAQAAQLSQVHCRSSRSSCLALPGFAAAWSLEAGSAHAVAHALQQIGAARPTWSAERLRADLQGPSAGKRPAVSVNSGVPLLEGATGTVVAARRQLLSSRLRRPADCCPGPSGCPGPS